MATLIRIPTGREGYPDVLDQILTHGIVRAPRGQETYDLGHTTVVFESPYNALPLGVRPKLAKAIAAAETLQLIGTTMDDDLLIKIAPAFANYREPHDDTFHGAYGRRLAVSAQLDHLVEKLRKDRDTRQAVATIWDPALDNLQDKRDYPCTVALGFSIRQDKLEMYTTMRSNDAWLGFPYDVFNFTQLQLTIAGVLGVEPGTYTHTAWSLHLYRRNEEEANLVADTAVVGSGPWQPEGVGSHDDIGKHFGTIRSRAQVLLRDPQPELILPEGLTASEEWFHAQLAPFLG